MIRTNGIVAYAMVAAVIGLSANLHAQTPRATVSYSIGIQGMTCETCSAHARTELAAVPGVVKADVDFKAGHAWVIVEASGQEGAHTARPRRIGTELAAAIKRAGYKPTVNYVLSIQGMTCEACSGHIAEAVSDVPGVAASSVNYDGGNAVVVPKEGADDLSTRLVAAVKQAGYRAAILTGP